MEIEEGQIIGGLFRVTKADFRQGGFADIHLAEDLAGRPVILKFPRRKSNVNPWTFKREYQTLLKFSHPHVAKALHFGVHEGSFFIAAEFVDGHSLRETTRSMNPAQMIPLFIQALEGLEAIHSLKLWHLDIKSSNVLVTGEGKVKIIDFGMAVVEGGLKPHGISGTPVYMSPEMILGKALDSRADLYSMGALFYYCVAGIYPFRKRERAGEDAEQLRKIVTAEAAPEKPSLYNINAPDYLDSIILDLLAKDPANRFASARAVINALKTHHPENYRETPESKGSYLVPEANRHIGREKEQKALQENLKTLLKGKQPSEALFWIHGGGELGKSHLLKKMKERAERKAEAVSIHFLELPKQTEEVRLKGNSEWIIPWLALLNQKLIENKKPVLILLDNVGCAPPILTGALKGFLKLADQRTRQQDLSNGNAPLMICLTSEKGWMAGECQSAYGKPLEICLKPFSREEVRAYLAATPALKNVIVPEEWVEAIYSQTAGYPGELKEKLTGLDSKGLLFGLDGKMHLAQLEDSSVKTYSGEEIPSKSRKRLSGILGELSDDEAEILEWMAVWCWKGFLTHISLHDLHGLSERNNLLMVLHALISKGMLGHDKEKDDYYFLPHSFWPILIYQNISVEERRRLHDSIFQYLGRQKRTDGAIQNAILMHAAYRENPGDTSGLRAVVQLGRQLMVNEGNVPLARELFEFGLSFAPERYPKVFACFAAFLIDACQNEGKYARAEEVFTDAWKKVENTQGGRLWKGLLLEKMANVRIQQALFDSAAEMVQKATELLKGLPVSVFHLTLRNHLGRISYERALRNSEKTAPFLQQAKEIFEESEKLEKGVPPRLFPFLRNNNLGMVLLALGAYAKAKIKLKKKLARHKKEGHLFGMLATTINLVDACRSLKDFSEALPWAESAIELAQRTGQGKWLLFAHYALANVYHDADRFEEAITEYDRCLVSAVCLEDTREQMHISAGAWIHKGHCYKELHRFREALLYFQEALRSPANPYFQMSAHEGMGETFFLEGNFEKSLTHLEQALKFLERLPPKSTESFRFPIMRLTVLCLCRLGCKEKAGTLLGDLKKTALKRTDWACQLKEMLKEMKSGRRVLA